MKPFLRKRVKQLDDQELLQLVNSLFTRISEDPVPGKEDLDDALDMAMYCRFSRHYGDDINMVLDRIINVLWIACGHGTSNEETPPSA